jgi:hypothetical protein
MTIITILQRLAIGIGIAILIFAVLTLALILVLLCATVWHDLYMEGWPWLR